MSGLYTSVKLKLDSMSAPLVQFTVQRSIQVQLHCEPVLILNQRVIDLKLRCLPSLGHTHHVVDDETGMQ